MSEVVQKRSVVRSSEKEQGQCSHLKKTGDGHKTVQRFDTKCLLGQNVAGCLFCLFVVVVLFVSRLRLVHIMFPCSFPLGLSHQNHSIISCCSLVRLIQPEVINGSKTCEAVNCNSERDKCL